MDAPNTDTTGGGMPPLAEGGAGTSPGSTAPPSWQGSLTDESLRSHQGLAKFKDVDGLAKSYIELDKLRNERGGIKPLTAESTPEDIAAYRQAMGIPEKPDAYDIGELAFPEEATPSQEQMAGWRQTFHELHLTPSQVKGIMQRYSQEVSGQWTTLQEARTAQGQGTMQALTKKYGAAAPQLAQMAHEYVNRRWGNEGLEALDFKPGEPTAPGNNPFIIELLIESAKLTGHDKFIIADGHGGMMDQESALAKYNEASKKFYATQDAGEKETLKAEMDRLARRAFSDPR